MTLADLAYIDATGYHYADYPTFRQFFVEGYQGIYGADTYLEDDSQDGQFISLQAQAAYDSAARGAATYNSFAPLSAQGTGLSRLVKINGIEREVPSFSTVTLTIVGTAGTVISNGSATDNLQQQWNLPASVTIPGGGTISVVATAAVKGAVTANSNTITTINTPTQGWQTVNNSGAAVPGAAVESDAALRLRQTISVANPSLTVLEGTEGAVANVTGVTKVQIYENDTGSTDGNSIPGHSICVVVAGGANADIANAIEIHKTPGCGTFGNTTVLVTDANGVPINISFQRAVAATIGVEISLSSNNPNQGWSTDYETAIARAVAAVINPIAIGGIVFYTKLFAPAYLPGPAGLTYTISQIRLKKNAGSFAVGDIDLAFDEEAVCDGVPGSNVVFIVS